MLIRPQPASLTSGSVQVPTARGEVSVAFTRSGARFTEEVDVPATATAEVALSGISAGQRAWVDGTPQVAAALPAGAAQPGAAAAGLAVVTVAPAGTRSPPPPDHLGPPPPAP